MIEDFSTINLNVDSLSELNLTDLFIKYLKKEIHNDQNNLYYCDFCKINTVTEKKIQLWKLPKKLIIVLKRYSPKGSKIITKVSFDEQLLIKETGSSDIKKYGLKGIINHIGDTAFGHYYSFIKKEDKWISIDDESINVLNKLNNNNNKSYILFYSTY